MERFPFYIQKKGEKETLREAHKLPHKSTLYPPTGHLEPLSLRPRNAELVQFTDFERMSAEPQKEVTQLTSQTKRQFLRSQTGPSPMIRHLKVTTVTSW